MFIQVKTKIQIKNDACSYAFSSIIYLIFIIQF